MRKSRNRLLNRAAEISNLASGGIRVPAAIGGRAPFNRCPFLIIVPGFNQKKRQRPGTVVIPLVKVQSLVQRFAAVALHVAIETPPGRRIVESRPGAANGNFVGMLLDDLVEILQVRLAPVPAIGSPSRGTGLHPSVGAREVVGKF